MESANWTILMDEPYNSYRRNAQGERDDVFCAPDLNVSDLDVVYESWRLSFRTATVRTVNDVRAASTGRRLITIRP